VSPSKPIRFAENRFVKITVDSEIGKVVARPQPPTPAPCGQYNLFTGEVDPARAERNGHDTKAGTGWLFDPDWGLVLPENVAGKEIVVDQGISLAFPAGHTEVPREPLAFGRGCPRLW